MTRRPAHTPCLGERVSALADGSLRDDVRDRALAHTLTCRACRDALDVERLTIARMHASPGPQPSERFLAELFALGETGGPVPPRRGPGPGMALPRPVELIGFGAMAGHRSVAAPPQPSGSVRPGGGTRPGPSRSRRRRQTFVVAAAGALGAGFVAAGLLTSAAGSPLSPSTRLPVAQFTLEPATGQQGGVDPLRVESGLGGYASGGYASGGYASGGYASGGYASGGYASGGYASGGPVGIGVRSDLVFSQTHVPVQALMATAFTAR